MKSLFVMTLAAAFAFAANAQAPAAKPASGSKAAPECVSAKTADAKFAAVDKNKDGVVDMAEAKATTGCGFKAYFDKNKVEKIDKATWLKMIDGRHADAKAKIDTNKDGKVSKDERAAAKK